MLRLRDNEYSNRTLYGIESKPIRYIWAGYFLFVILSSLIGDTTILIASIKYKAFKLQKIVVVIIQHIAVCDLMVTVTTVIPMLFTVTINEYVFGNFLCYWSTYSKYYLYLTSLFLICNMTTSKALLLKYPLRFKTVTLRKAHFSCVVCWSLALSLPVMFLFVDRSDVYFSYRSYACDYGFSAEICHVLRPILTLLFMFIPTCHVVATTIYVLVLARQIARRGRETLKWQGITTIALVAVGYCISVLPQGAYRFGESFFDRDDESKKIFFATYIKIAQSILWLNTISNFYIYSLTVRSFRNFLCSKLKPSNQFPISTGITSKSGEIILK
jgi:hypothetical protein